MQQRSVALRFFLIVILLGCLGWFSAQPALASTTILYVAPSGLTSGACNSWANACDLQYALTNAAADSELWVKAGTYRPTTAADRFISFQLKNGVALYGGFAGAETLREQRDWAANLTILSGDIGANDMANPITNLNQIVPNNSYHVVTGGGTNASAILDGFTITAGTADGSTLGYGNGGGMYNDMGSPTLNNLIFQGNIANGGGGMSNFNSHPTLTNVIFKFHSAMDGGALHNSGSNPVLTNVTLMNNTASSGRGGAIFNINSSPALTNVTMNANSAQQGGGMFNISGSNPTLTDVTFLSNTASNQGGGMYNQASNPTLMKVTFDANSATNAGGGIYNDAGNLVLTNATFWANTGAMGGGLYTFNSSPSLNNVTFSGNSATYMGGSGAIANFGTDIMSLKNSIVWGNTPMNTQIYDFAATATVSYSVIEGGYAGTGNLNTNPLLGPLADNGGFTKTIALDLESSAVNTADNATCAATDQRGTARPQLGGCDMGAYELLIEIIVPTYTHHPTQTPSKTFTRTRTPTLTLTPSATVTVTQTPTITPTGGIPGPMLYVVSDGLTSGLCDSWVNACDLQYALTGAVANSELWVKAGTYTPTTGTDKTISFQLKNGVAVYGGFAGTETLRTQRDFDVNETKLISDIGIPGDTSDNSYHVVIGSGTNLSSVLDGFTITGGTTATGELASTYYGAGMYNNYGSPTLRNLRFYQNITSSMGGGMANENNSNPTLTNVDFSYNIAMYGGGLYNNASSPTLTDVNFLNNSVGENGYGGGMVNKNSAPILTRVTFDGNIALGGVSLGGGMFNDASNPTLTDVVFRENQATGGGGLSNIINSSAILTNVLFDSNTAGAYGGGVASGSGGFLLMENVTFTGNTAAFNGGGVSMGDGSLTIENATFTGNTAANGGALRIKNGNVVTLTNVTINDNSATVAGGIFNDHSNPTLTNVTFAGNFASDIGGGISNLNSSPILTNVTFSGNSASRYGGAMGDVGNGSNPVIRNSILWGNTPVSIYNSSGTTTISYSIVQGGYPGTGNLDLDPLLQPLNNNGGFTETMALGVGSPAVGAGENATCAATDQRGVPRPQDMLCDMGAFEAQLTELTATPSLTPTASATIAETLTPTPTVTPTATSTPTQTVGASPTLTKTPTPTNTSTAVPGADFVGTPLSGNAPLVVQFTALNASILNTCTWTFGDGNSQTFTADVGQSFSVCPSTSHTYTSAGSFTVSLMVRKVTGASNTMSKSNYVQVNPALPTPTPTLTLTATITLTRTPTATVTRTPTKTATPVSSVSTFQSVANQDGWILESGENSNQGGSLNNSATTFQLGDDASNRQYRVILSFNTASLPDNAVIQSVTIKIKHKDAVIGSNPFNVLGSLWIDIRKGPFGTGALQLTDFNAAASAVKVGAFGTPVSSWYSAVLNTTGKNNINKVGHTQFRLYFNLDDNNNQVANLIKFLSGNAANDKPELVVRYILP
jgi:predicted outer membrane repeat protein